MRAYKPSSATSRPATLLPALATLRNSRRRPAGAPLDPRRHPWLACRCMTLGHIAPSGVVTRRMIKAVVTSMASPATGVILFKILCLVLR